MHPLSFIHYYIVPILFLGASLFVIVIVRVILFPYNASAMHQQCHYLPAFFSAIFLSFPGNILALDQEIAWRKDLINIPDIYHTNDQ